MAARGHDDEAAEIGSDARNARWAQLAPHALLLCLLLGCASPASAPPPSESCSPGVYGVPELDALLEVRVDGRIALTDARTSEWLGSPVARALAHALDRAAGVDPSRLDVASRAVLQHDLWGLFERVSAIGVETEDSVAIFEGSGALVRRLAPPRTDVVPVAGALPAVLAVLGPGFVERESEMPVLSHERAFGLRRLFRVAVRGDNESERAMFSTVLALDEHGEAFRTDVVGDLEVLRFEGDRLVHARLFELDRRRLRCEGSAHALTEVDHVAQVPGLGADRPIAAFDSSVPLADLPCARCHDDAMAMSLPSARLAVGRRQAALLAQRRALPSPFPAH